jgi:hypothetical protein
MSTYNEQVFFHFSLVIWWFMLLLVIVSCTSTLKNALFALVSHLVVVIWTPWRTNDIFRQSTSLYHGITFHQTWLSVSRQNVKEAWRETFLDCKTCTNQPVMSWRMFWDIPYTGRISKVFCLVQVQGFQIIRYM